MALFLDQKYLHQISSTLPLFKKKGQRVWNFRCTLCGDSAKNKHKARAFFYVHEGKLKFKCHNCGENMTFGFFLKQHDSMVYQQYQLERFEDRPLRKSPEPRPLPKYEGTAPLFPKKTPLDTIAIRLDRLPEEHEARVYATSRRIEGTALRKLYFLDDISKVSVLAPEYAERVQTHEPRLLIPFYGLEGQLTGVTLRALRGESLRYMSLKFIEDEMLIFGLKDIDRSQTVIVCEGAFDSLFLRNAIACNGTSFGKIESLGIPKEQIVVVFDNQPRNREVCKIQERYIRDGYSVVIWPTIITQKDVNDMVLAGLPVNDVVTKNTFSGMMAQMQFQQWKRC
jgi:hypothetical protein